MEKEFKPILSVITVVFNNVKHIERTLKSVINQTYSAIEYIIIDGASTDGTLEIINRFKNEIDVNCDINGDFNAEGDPRIVVQAEVHNNELTIPDGLITDCGFKGIFTNARITGKP